MNKLKTLAIAAALCAANVSAHAASVVFEDNFNANVAALNGTPAGWSVTDGTVDIVGPGDRWGWLCAGSNNTCIDLDGSSNNAGILSKSISVTAGQTYTLSFDLAGNQRNHPIPSSVDDVTVTFGSASQTLAGIVSAAPWQTHSLSFTAATSGSVSLSFANAGGDNGGAVLDNVRVTAVPEPETYAMLLAGLSLVGALARRKQSKAA